MFAVLEGPPLIVGEMGAHVRLHEFRLKQVSNVVRVVAWNRYV